MRTTSVSGRRPASSPADHFHQYLRDSFDTLYAESATTPKMMSIGLHARMIGRPGRIAGLARFIEHAQAHEGIWFATREESPATGWLLLDMIQTDRIFLYFV